MKRTGAIGRDRAGAAARASAGFTLAEVLVAIAALLVLAVAIGRLFTSVGTLVNTGTASSEVDTLARSIEERIRADIDRMNALAADEVFIAIRGNRIGDINLDGDTSDAGEVALYINQADREADEREGGTSRALGSTRLDEILFVAKGPWTSVQQDAGSQPFSADAAMISYGHGLYAAFRPPTDPEAGVDPENLDTFPRRTITPAGLQADDDPWISAYGARFSANEYAGRFPLTRQAVLLPGGAQVATEGSTTGLDPVSVVGPTRVVAPTVRDLENEWLKFGDLTTARVRDTLLNDSVYSRIDIGSDINDAAAVELASASSGSELDLPRFGLLRWGRVDIAAQSLLDVRRWFEGQTNPWLVDESDTNQWPVVDYNPPYGDASAFSSGYFDVPEPEYMAVDLPDGGGLVVANGPAQVGIDSPLWLRAGLGNDSAFGFLGGTGTDEPSEVGVRRTNEAALQSAIAGVFARRLVSDGVPTLRRIAGADAELEPQDEALDLAFVLANRCSRFEVAWSNGLTVPEDVEQIRVDNDGDGEFDGPDDRVFRTGELIWFDQAFPYVAFLGGAGVNGTGGSGGVGTGLPRAIEFEPSASGNFTQTITGESNPEARSAWRLRDASGSAPGALTDLSVRDDWDNTVEIDSAGNALSGTNVGPDAGVIGFFINGASGVANDDVYGGYDPFVSGGADEDNADTEYLAIWGFRRATGDGGWGGAWEKPRFLRFRMTLHDSEFRLDRGRTYEFIVEVDPKPAATDSF